MTSATEQQQVGVPDFQAILEALPAPVSTARALRDESGTIVDFVSTYANPAALAIAGIQVDQRHELVGQRILEVAPVIREIGMFDKYVHVVETGETLVEGPYPFEGDLLGRHISGVFEIHVVKFGDGYLSASRDVTNEHRTQEDLAMARAEIEVKRRASKQAVEINNNIIHSLVQATRELDEGDLRGAQAAVRETLEHASRIVTELRTT